MTVRILPALHQTAEIVDIDTLEHWPGNARVGHMETLLASLGRHGQYKPVIYQASTRRVVVGNHTLRGMRELGATQIAAVGHDLPDDEARAIGIVDNRSNDLATWDDHLLLTELEQMPMFDDGTFDLTGTGFDQDDLDKLLVATQPEPDQTPDTDPSEPPVTPRTNPGELWALGSHRLLCGDAREPDDVVRLMAGEKANAIWTDPPYGVDYEGKTADALTIAGDQPDTLEDLLTRTFAAAKPHLKPGAAIYVAHAPGPMSLIVGQAFTEHGWRFHETLVWVKDTMVLGHSDYHYRHELILFGYAQGGGRRGRGGRGWYGDNSQTTVFEIPRPKASPDHPTPKPVELVTAHLSNSTAPRHRVLDPFGGSGSTLIACEDLGRTGYLLELEPAYCDVIIDRWERHTGQTATQEST
jgi:DNA modification methylase